MQCILTVRYDLQFASKLRHLRGQLKKACTDGIPVKFASQKQIVGTDMEVECDLNQKLQRWFSLSAFHISEMLDTDIKLLRVFRRSAKLAVSKLYILFQFRLMRGAEGYTCMQYGPEPSEPDKGAKI